MPKRGSDRHYVSLIMPKKEAYHFTAEELAAFDFSPPSRMDTRRFMQPFTLYFSPEYIGLRELTTDRPALFITNHTVWGLLDGYPFGAELYVRKNIFIRALADRNHFRLDAWGNFVRQFGLVLASRRNCAALMERKENILVFPGGAREICKRKGEAYTLKWNDRSGFVRMAMLYGYDIIPVAGVGGEEAYTVEKDATDFMQTIPGKLLHLTGLDDQWLQGGQLIPPKISGVGGTLLPRPVKLFFSFGPRISTRGFKKHADDKERQQQLKDKVIESMQQQFADLFARRDRYVERNPLKRWLLKQ